MKKTLLFIALVAAVCLVSSCRPSRPACPAYSQIANAISSVAQN